MVRRGSCTTKRSVRRKRRLPSATALSFSPLADQTGVLTSPCLCLRICLCLYICLSLHGQTGQVSSPFLVFDLSLYLLLSLSLSLSLSFSGLADRTGVLTSPLPIFCQKVSCIFCQISTTSLTHMFPCPPTYTPPLQLPSHLLHL